MLPHSGRECGGTFAYGCYCFAWMRVCRLEARLNWLLCYASVGLEMARVWFFVVLFFSSPSLFHNWEVWRDEHALKLAC